MDPTWFHAFIKRCNRRRSLPSVQEWIARGADQRHQGQGAAPTSAAGGVKLITESAAAHRRQADFSARNDVRTSAGASGEAVDLSFPPSGSSIDTINVFANLYLHDQAAASIASYSQQRSGFTAAMPTEDGVALERFIAYLNEFVAPHWFMSYSHVQNVTHSQETHSKFVESLVGIVLDGLRAAGGDAESEQKVEENVRNLAGRLSSSTSNEEKLTLFSTSWMERVIPTDPVIFGIFYTTLDARYENNGKAEVLSSNTITYSVIFSLISSVLIQNAGLYNTQLQKTAVQDWLTKGTI